MTLHHKQEERGTMMTFKRVGCVKMSGYLTISQKHTQHCLLHVHKVFAVGIHLTQAIGINTELESSAKCAIGENEMS